MAEIIGREQELASLNAFLERGADCPSALVLEGEAGIGKSTLWVAGIESAREQRFRVLSSRPSEAETRFSFAGLTDLIGDVVGEALPELPPVQRRALEAALLLGESETKTNERVVAAAFLSTLRALSQRDALVIAVDDLQWLDAPSLATLRFALPRLRTEPVLAFLAVRGGVPAWLQRGVPEERLLVIELHQLSMRAIHELLGVRLDTTFAQPVVRRIWKTSAGNPFFALELARALRRRGGVVGTGDELPIPEDLEALVGERVGELSPTGLEVARAVAALAEPTLSLVETVAPRKAEPGLADALRSRVLELDGERVRFTHPLLAAVIWSRTQPARRRLLHKRLASVVPSAEERARHLALAATRPSREVASALEDAALTAHVRGAPAAAAELADHALRLTPAADAADARRRQLIAGDRHFDAGDNERAIALLEQASAAAVPGVEQATALVHLAWVESEVVGPRRAVALYREALAETEGDDELEAAIHTTLAELMRFTEGVERGLEHAELAVRAASRIDDATLRCRALGTYGLMRFNAGNGIPRTEMEEALALERALQGWPLVVGPTWVLGQQLFWSGDLGSGRSLLHQFREALHARNDPEEAVALWHLSFLEWRAGNWALAAQHLADSYSVTTQAGRVGMWFAQEAPATAIAAHKGEIDEARTQAGRAIADAEAAGIRVSESGHRWVLGFIELSLGNAAAALEHLRRAREIRDAFVLEPGMRLELADLLEALVAVGELDEAEQILVLWEERARALDRAWALAWLARCRGLLLAAGGDAQGAFGAFDRALAEHARSIDPFHHARTLLALGTTQRRAKQRGAARRTLESALEIFERLGAPLWAERTRAELERIGGRAPSRDTLTKSERRIAALVAEGNTNREVAAALFLTEHTVETALSRVYRKLGVRSRVELTNQIARQTREAPTTKS